jgi:hypothetical protein
MIDIVLQQKSFIWLRKNSYYAVLTLKYRDIFQM